MARTRLTAAAALATALGSLVLWPLLEDAGWMLSAFGVVLLVALAGEGCRRIAVPTLVTVLVQLVVVAGYVMVVFAHREAGGGILPGAVARDHLQLLLDAGRDDIDQLAPPVPTSQGVVLLTTLGVAAIAVLVDLLAAGMRRAAVAGLPLFALFVVPAGVAPDGIGALPFSAAGAGFLVLLLADGRERVGRWGRPLRPSREPRPGGPALRAEQASTAPLARLGRRIGAASLGLALVVPAVVPGLSEASFGGGDGTGDGGGGNPKKIVTYNPIVALKGQLTSRDRAPLIRYTADGDPAYLRMTTLDVFDGETWKQSDLSAGRDQRVSEGLPLPDGLDGDSATRPLTVSATATQRLEVSWLPVPYPPVEVTVEGDWRYDAASRTIFSSRVKTNGARWVVRSAIPIPVATDLRSATGPGFVRQLAQVQPGTVPARVTTLARQITARAKTDYERAVALQRHLRTFSYSTQVPAGNSGSALVDFLFETQRGYCEQFAAAMAVMARTLGLPARVNIGFTQGNRQRNGSWLVTENDAHAWPEIYFVGYGWLPFEPTPRSDGTTREPPYTRPEGTTPEPAATATPTPVPLPTTTARPEPQRSGDPGAGASADDGGSGPGAWATLGILGIVGVALSPGLSRWLVRRRRWADAATPAARAHAAWHELRDDVRDLRLPWRDVDGPRAGGLRLAREYHLGGQSLAALRRLATAEERARYAPSMPEGADDLRRDVATVRRALEETAGPGARLRARAWPTSSLVTAAHWSAGIVADVLDGVDAVVARAVRVARRLLPGRS